MLAESSDDAANGVAITLDSDTATTTGHTLLPAALKEEGKTRPLIVTDRASPVPT